MDITAEKIKEAVSAYEIQQHKRFKDKNSSLYQQKLRQAAVLIPLLVNEGSWHVLLTNRSERLVQHSGQVAFPGGAREGRDNDLQMTALRETFEEVGINPDDVVLFGHLGDMPIITGDIVRVFVGQIPWPYPIEISTDEVDSVFIVPLDWLADPVNRCVQYRSYAGHEYPVIYFNRYDDYQLWGASAEITMALLAALGQSD